MNLRPLLQILAAGFLIFRARAAIAAEPEAVRFEVDGPPGCVGESAVRDEIGLLGGRFRDANLDDRARTIRIEVANGNDTVIGRLVLRDLVFRETVREVHARSCLEATRSLALFAATVLDEAPPPLSLAPSEPGTPPPPPWPAPTDETDRTLRERAPRLGSGGFTIAGAGGFGTSVSSGFRASAAWRIGGTTRLGIVGAIMYDDRDHHGHARRTVSRGISSRVGALFGWGAPWNDSVVGFATELGVLWGGHHGGTYPAVSGETCAGGLFIVSVSAQCYDVTRGSPARWSFASPYVAPQLVFQVPFKNVPVRPIVSLGLLWAPIGPGSPIVALTGETGIAWQAW